MNAFQRIVFTGRHPGNEYIVDAFRVIGFNKFINEQARRRCCGLPRHIVIFESRKHEDTSAWIMDGERTCGYRESFLALAARARVDRTIGTALIRCPEEPL